MKQIPDTMRPFLEQLPLGVVLLDGRLNFLFCNEKALEWLRVPVEELMGGTFLDTLTSAPLKTALQGFQDSHGGSETIYITVGPLHLSVALSRIANEQEEGILILLDDITRYKSLDTIKSDFITTLLHKLRSPLTSVKTALSLITVDSDHDLSDKKKELFKLSLKEVDRLNRLLGQLRSVFSIETGLFEKEIEIESVDLSTTLKSAIKETARHFAAPETIPNRIVVTCPNITVQADFEKLQEVLVHLIENALLYSEGEVRITASTTDASIALEISDNGIGIAEKDGARVYEKYFRTDEAARRNPEGDGLGLYLARAFLGSFGGSLYFDSQPGKGTTFYLTLKGKEVATCL